MILLLSSGISTTLLKCIYSKIENILPSNLYFFFLLNTQRFLNTLRTISNNIHIHLHDILINIIRDNSLLYPYSLLSVPQPQARTSSQHHPASSNPRQIPPHRKPSTVTRTSNLNLKPFQPKIIASNLVTKLLSKKYILSKHFLITPSSLYVIHHNLTLNHHIPHIAFSFLFISASSFKTCTSSSFKYFFNRFKALKCSSGTSAYKTSPSFTCLFIVTPGRDTATACPFFASFTLLPSCWIPFTVVIGFSLSKGVPGLNRPASTSTPTIAGFDW